MDAGAGRPADELFGDRLKLTRCLEGTDQPDALMVPISSGSADLIPA
jgi:hypothetical protein